MIKLYSPQSLKDYYNLLKPEEFDKDNYKKEQLSQTLYRSTLVRKYLEIF